MTGQNLWRLLIDHSPQFVRGGHLYTDVSLPYPAGRYRTLGRGVSPPAPGADMPGTPHPRGAIAIWVPLFGFCYPVYTPS